MREQELKNSPECDKEQPFEQCADGETNNKENNTAAIVWLVVAISCFTLSIVCFALGVIGIFVSLGMLMLPIVGIFGIIFTVLSFLGGVLFLALGVVAVIFYIRSRKKSEEIAKTEEMTELVERA